MEELDIGNKNLRDLDSTRFLKIQDHLNISNSPDHGWRAFVACLDGEYKLTHEEIRKISNAESPTEALFKRLGNLRMTIDEFISYATRAGDAVLMNIFHVQIALEIIDHPVSEVIGVEGDMLTLSVQATGFPAPSFRWCKDKVWIPGASSRYLELNDLQQQDAGVYRCAVVQGTDIANLQFSNPSVVIIKPAPDIEISQQPLNAPVCIGGTALLSCQVWGPTHLKFQWFRGETPLRDDSRTRGCKTNELALYDIDETLLGCYFCQISSSRQCVETKGAVVQISEKLMYSGHEEYTATDKVALLIGCADYRADKPLNAPSNDVQTLASIFRSLNFKVVTLLDLTRKEIIAAVNHFSQLVDQGVYCVFYFCGHGFEGSGQQYLVPCDAPIGYTNIHSVSAHQIGDILLRKEPKLFCMILDVCRRQKDIYPTSSDHREAARGPNTIVVYGTSHGQKAFEVKSHGFLVKHLKNFLSLPIPVETVFAKFRHAMSQERLISGEKKQFANVDTNLTDIGRSFADPIVYKGFTAEFNQRQEIWENAHRIPPTQAFNVPFPGFTAQVRLEFEQEFSNKLNIYTTVIDPGLAKSCSAWICGIPNSVREKAKNTVVKGDEGIHHFRSYVQLPNIHRLKSNLTIKVLVSCKQPDFTKEFMVDLGRPLISTLRLSEDQPDFTKTRQPQEDDESSYEESLSSKTQSLLL